MAPGIGRGRMLTSQSARRIMADLIAELDKRVVSSERQRENKCEGASKAAAAS